MPLLRNSPVLSDTDLAQLTEWRRDLHRHPELSGHEAATAARAVAMLQATSPDRIVTGLGGHGVAAIFSGRQDGPTVMLRCELDALPIEELSQAPHRSTIAGQGHLCGHDGHMAIMAGVARWLDRNQPEHGRAILLFQPAEEDGSGAARVLADPAFADIAPDFALSLHNYPGIPVGQALLAEGPMNCASRGMKIGLGGRTAHASQPETGRSPAGALAELLGSMPGLGRGGDAAEPEFSLVTITHARLGEPAFGIAPGEAELWVTLRSQKDEGMARLVTAAESMVTEAADRHGLRHAVAYHDIFHHCENAPEATAILRQALDRAEIAVSTAGLPMRASEDFGLFGRKARAAMFLLGAGVDHPALHNPDYDFPDALIAQGARVFAHCLEDLLGCGRV